MAGCLNILIKLVVFSVYLGNSYCHGSVFFREKKVISNFPLKAVWFLGI